MKFAYYWPKNLKKRREKYNNVDARIQKVLASVFISHKEKFEEEWGPAEITDWDSMNHLNLIMALGEEFGVTLDFEEMLAIKTIGDIKTILNKHGVN